MMTASLRRIGRMTPAEIAWRTRAALRTGARRTAFHVRDRGWDAIDARKVFTAAAFGAPLSDVLASRPGRFVIDPALLRDIRTAVQARWPGTADAAARRAERLIGGHYDLLGYRSLPVAPPDGEIDWHHDPVHDRRAPRAFWTDVPYLDPAVGDHKVIWEINRHQHWLQFGRALWLTGDERYGRAIVRQLDGWMAANPPLVGINWASMLEISLRAISWTAAVHFFLGADLKVGPQDPAEGVGVYERLLIGIHRQLTHVEENLSHYFSPNTHLTGEALGLYVVGLAFPELAASERWIDTGRRILLAEIDRQILPDGGHVERSTHYQRYTLDFYLLARLAAERAGDTGALAPFTDAVARLADYTRAMADDNGRLPLIGDDDGGMLWPLAGRDCADVRDSLALAALVLDRAELAPWEVPEETFWIGGRRAIDGAPAHDARIGHVPPAPSRTFARTGYVVIRDAGSHGVFDTGAHGYMNGGHAHADALSLSVALEERPLLVDPGTATYTMDLELRDRLRGSASHNTVTIDGRPAAIPAGPFHWQTRADASLRASRHNPAFDWAEGTHDGYAPLLLRRALLRTRSGGWLVVDDIAGDGMHLAAAHWQFHPEWQVAAEGHRLRATHIDGDVAWLLCDAGEIDLAHGDELSGRGWFAPAYGTLLPAWSARVSRREGAPFACVTWIGSTAGVGAPALDRLPMAPPAGEGAVAARVSAGAVSSTFLLRPADVSPAGSCLVGDVATDARVLHYRERGGQLIELDLVDATGIVTPRDGWWSLSSPTMMSDLHVSLSDGVLDLRSSQPPPELQLHAAGGTVMVLGADWREGHARAPLCLASTAGASL